MNNRAPSWNPACSVLLCLQMKALPLHQLMLLVLQLPCKRIRAPEPQTAGKRGARTVHFLLQDAINLSNRH